MFFSPKTLFAALLLNTLSLGLFAQTMSFDTGASEPGFSFSNWVWDGADQVVFPSAPNVNTLMTITKSDGGCWTAISVNPSCWSGNCSPPGGGTWRVFSDKGHEAFFTVQTSPQVINLGWEKIKSLYVQLDDPGTGNPNNTFNFDNVVYDIPSYVSPSQPVVNYDAAPICPGGEVQIELNGSLNDGTHWTISSEGCGVNETVLNGTTTSVTPFETTDYWFRGIDECGCAIPGECLGPVTVEVLPSGCTNADACNYDPAIVCEDGSCFYPELLSIDGVLNQTSGGFFFSCAGGETARLPLGGYNCGIVDELTVGGIPTAISAADYEADPPYIEFITPAGLTNALLEVTNFAGTSEVNNLVFVGAGCTNPASCNYDPMAECDNGSCCPLPTYTPASEPVLSYVGGECLGPDVELIVDGDLNNATGWYLYSGACGETLLEVIPAGESFFLNVTETTTFYIRGEDDCACTAPGSCAQITVELFTYGCTDDQACNYDPEAECSSDDCEYASCACPGDLNGDGEVGTADLLQLLASFGTNCGFPFCPGDLDGDGSVGSADILGLLAAFGTPCP